ncbi:MAG: hypothetical protein JXB62_03575 [Pirellulales bacterium]|nr:hypothetical protein [Pirellulales bacterium]
MHRPHHVTPHPGGTGSYRALIRRALHVCVLVGIVVSAFLLRGRDNLPSTPADAVSRWFDASEQGDDETCLRLVCGRFRQSLEQSRSQMGATAFREHLRRSVAGVKCLAIIRNDTAPDGGVLLEVNMVFADHDERQEVHLCRQEAGWMITSVERSRVSYHPPRTGD